MQLSTKGVTVGAVALLAAMASAGSPAELLNVSGVQSISTGRVLGAARAAPQSVDNTYAVTFRSGSLPVKNAVAFASTTAPGVRVVDGRVSIGGLPAHGSVTPADTVTVRVEPGRTFDPASLKWRFEAPPAGPAVNLSVEVSDKGVAQGGVTYRWRSTDGNIVDANSPTTRWTLPDGPGLHFAYVLVNNNQGGFTERRVAVNTDVIGTPIVVPGPRRYAAPPAPPALGYTYRNRVSGARGELPINDDFGGPIEHDAYLADALLYFTDDATGALIPPEGPANPIRTDARGEFIVPNVPEGASFTGMISVNGGITYNPRMGASGEERAYYFTYTLAGPDGVNSPPIVGRVRLADDGICGTKNEFFDLDETGVATMLNGAGTPFGYPSKLSLDGDFSFSILAGVDTGFAKKVKINCHGARSTIFPIDGNVNTNGNVDMGIKTLDAVRAPIISGMSAKLDDGTAVGLFLPPPTGFPSDNVPDPERFLSFRGIDSRLSACLYYKTVGAVLDCDADGNFIGAINVEDWKRVVRIGKYAIPGHPEYSAVYINQVDLNLTRNHHSITYGPTRTAAYVCNHLGTPTLDPTQADIDLAVDNAVAGKNLVACVMMDSIAQPGVGDGQPYTRFLIFGPSGQLLPSINLDGRREKFVPGVCVACHGGERYKGHFPADGSGAANIGAHFLPYDIGNFAFSSKPGYTRRDQERSIYYLNQNVLKSGATQAASDLITGWYGTGKFLNTNYIPASWAGQGFDDVYHKVIAKSCRTCHVNFKDYNLDDFPAVRDFAIYKSCGWTAYHSQNSKWSMPNSLVTFNRFWRTKGTKDDLTALLASFLSANGDVFSDDPPSCKLVKLP